MLLNQIALGIGIMFAPIFILCLLFQQTQNLFYHWLKYSVTLVFSMAVLTVMVSICVKVAIAYAGAILVLLSAGGSIMDAAMLQAGLGIVLTVLMVSVPPMVVNFFSSAMHGGYQGNSFRDLIGGTVNRNTPVPANSAAAGSGSPTTGGQTPSQILASQAAGGAK